MVNPRSVRAGFIASGALAVFYAVVVGGASQSLGHLTDQARMNWYLLVPIIAGFGVQVALRLRQFRTGPGGEVACAHA